MLRSALIFGGKTAFGVVVGIGTALLSGIFGFLLMASLNLTSAPPTAVFQAPAQIERAIQVIIEAGEKYIAEE